MTASHAIIVERAGGAEELQWRERPGELVPAADEVLVETAAVGVNFIEIYQRSGLYTVQYPFTLAPAGWASYSPSCSCAGVCASSPPRRPMRSAR